MPCLANIISVACVCACLVSCLSVARSGAMVPHVIDVVHRHPQKVDIRIYALSSDSPLGTQLKVADLEAAIAESVRISGLFSEVVDASESDYELRVRIEGVTHQQESPLSIASRITPFGASVDATWLVVARDGRAVAEERVSSQYANNNPHEMRRLLEGAIRRNIAEAFLRLSTENLPEVGSDVPAGEGAR